MEEKDLWVKKWKDRLDNYNESLPAAGWEQLEKELLPVAEKRLFLHRRWIAVAASVLLVVGTSLSLYFLESQTAHEMRQTSLPTLAKITDTLPHSAETTSPEVVNTEVKKGSDRTLVGSSLLAKNQEEPRILNSLKSDAVGIDSTVPIDISEKSSASDVADVVKSEETTTHADTPQTRKPSGRDKLHLPQQSTESRSGRWAIGASVGNAGALSGSNGNIEPRGELSRLNMSAVADGVLQVPGDKTVVFKEGVPYLQVANEVMEIEHHQPLSFGLSVRKTLPKGFSVETGLTYTLLSSDVKLAKSATLEDQRLHYIGIPIRANWNFVDKKLFTLYVSAGGTVEKCVYGELAGEKITVKPLQLSVMGAVGAQINATKHLGIYVEPGVVHFFNDGSEVKTIRKDNPVNFNIQAGVRFTY